jgi:hypothetical protein
MVRGTAPVSPGNRTGRIYQKQLREKQARDAASTGDRFKAGLDQGFSAGYDAGVQAVIRQLQAEGIIGPDEPGEAE